MLDKDTKKNLITLIVILSLLLGFIAFCFIYINISDRKLREDPVYTDAIIIEQFSSKGGTSLRYKFFVMSTKYEGTSTYDDAIQDIRIGDTCRIIYYRKDPSLNEAVKNNKGFIVSKPNRDEFYFNWKLIDGFDSIKP